MKTDLKKYLDAYYWKCYIWNLNCLNKTVIYVHIRCNYKALSLNKLIIAQPLLLGW